MLTALQIGWRRGNVWTGKGFFILRELLMETTVIADFTCSVCYSRSSFYLILLFINETKCSHMRTAERCNRSDQWTFVDDFFWKVRTKLLIF
jgi:hypothetical protein